jgi:hypothetical protein
MRCESCESDIVEGEVRTLPRADLSSAAAKGFGPWGNSPPSMEWPRFVRALWWKGAAAVTGDATLCASCDAALASFAPPSYEHDWLAGLRETIAAAGLRTPETPQLGGVPEIDALAMQLARDLAVVPAGQGGSLKGGFEKHGERYGLAAATILLTGEETGQTLRPRFGAAELLAEWDDPRGTGFLLRALRHPVYISWVAPKLVKRGDPNALPEVAEALTTFLRLDDAYAADGEPPFKTPYFNVEPIKAAHPDLAPLDLLRISQASVAIGHLLGIVTALGEREWRIGAAREVYAHSLFHDDVMHAANDLLQFADPTDAEAIAITVAGQGYGIGIGDSFQRSMELLVRQQSAAGWWAMDRFCRTAQHWQDRAGKVRSHMAKIAKPSEEALRKYERRYGRFVDFKRTGKASPKSGGCFIATAAYGSEDHVEVVRLRAFRDDVLRRSRSGRAAIRIYERVSPPLADVVRRSPTCRATVRALILRPVRLFVMARKGRT